MTDEVKQDQAKVWSGAASLLTAIEAVEAAIFRQAQTVTQAVDVQRLAEGCEACAEARSRIVHGDVKGKNLELQTAVASRYISLMEELLVFGKMAIANGATGFREGVAASEAERAAAAAGEKPTGEKPS